MINVNAVREQVGDILRRFPSAQGTVWRPEVDEYQQPTGEKQLLGEVTFWWKQPEYPTRVEAAREGATYAEDDPKWACMLWSENLPDVMRGDYFESAGKRYRIANRTNRMNVRVFWQLIEVEE